MSFTAPLAAKPPRPVDLLIHDADVVTFDDAGSVIVDGAIAVEGNSIAWLGKAEDAPKLFKAKTAIKATGLTAMPGLIDTHYHTGQQLMRGKLAAINRKGPSRSPHWKHYYVPFESALTPDDVYYSAISGYTSMISAGTTCFLEAGGPQPDEMGRAADEIGIRGRIALSTMDADDDELPRTYRMTTDQALRANQDLVERWRKHPRVNAWLSLRQIMVNTETLRIEAAKLAQGLDTGIHTHLSEGTYEIDYALATYGLRPPAYFEKIGLLTNRLHCAYSPLLTPEEVDLYGRYDVSVAHCAFNFYGMAPHGFSDMVRKGMRVGLGTDGTGSRCTLDLFQVAHYAVIGQQIIAGLPQYAPEPLGYDRMLKLAVRQGARAARMGAQLGSLEVGKLADIVLVATTDYDQYPSVDPVITLAQNCVGRDVRTVIIDGRIVMRDRQFQTIDLESMQRRVNEQYLSLMERYDNALNRGNTPG
ncbi:MAG: amidohydrolase family protein [Bryobacterales bacterium]|nr:amidohydrolase family protein [Bryobacterales bacterium]